MCVCVLNRAVLYLFGKSQRKVECLCSPNGCCRNRERRWLLCIFPSTWCIVFLLFFAGITYSVSYKTWIIILFNLLLSFLFSFISPPLSAAFLAVKLLCFNALLYLIIAYFSDAGLSHADREASLELIKLDISRTFPNLCIFQQVGCIVVTGVLYHLLTIVSCFGFYFQRGPYHDVLHSILGAYTCYRPDVGYVSLVYSSDVYCFFCLNVLCTTALFTSETPLYPSITHISS